MGQTNCRDSRDPTPPRTTCRFVYTPEEQKYCDKNAQNIQDLLKWTRDEFVPDKYASKVSNPVALKAEIKKKCNEKLDEKWSKFGFY